MYIAENDGARRRIFGQRHHLHAEGPKLEPGWEGRAPRRWGTQKYPVPSDTGLIYENIFGNSTLCLMYENMLFSCENSFGCVLRMKWH